LEKEFLFSPEYWKRIFLFARICFFFCDVVVIHIHKEELAKFGLHVREESKKKYKNPAQYSGDLMGKAIVLNMLILQK
jgi:hypothetical protein